MSYQGGYNHNQPGNGQNPGQQQYGNPGYIQPPYGNQGNNQQPYGNSGYSQPQYGMPTPIQYNQVPQQQFRPPVPGFVVTEPQYVINQPVTLKIKETIGGFSNDDFKITDLNRNVWFMMDSKAFSFRDKRTLLSQQGQPVLTLQKKLFSFGNKWLCYRGASTDQSIFSVEPKIFTLTPNIKIYLKDGDREPDFQIKGNFRARDFQFYDIRNGAKIMIAQCEKKLPSSVGSFVSQFIFHADEYYLTMQPGCDAAFCVSLCVLLDDLFQDEKHD